MKTLREFLEEAKQFQVEEVVEEEIDLDEVEDEIEEVDESDEEDDEELEEEAPKGYGGRAVTGSRAGYWKSMRQNERDAEYEDKYHRQLAAAKRKRERAMANEEAEQIDEAADVELKPHPNGTHYIVHKIHPKSGIEADQMKVGEKISDTHVDDLHDMGYNVKIHKK